MAANRAVDGTVSRRPMLNTISAVLDAPIGGLMMVVSQVTGKSSSVILDSSAFLHFPDPFGACLVCRIRQFLGNRPRILYHLSASAPTPVHDPFLPTYCLFPVQPFVPSYCFTQTLAAITKNSYKNAWRQTSAQKCCYSRGSRGTQSQGSR